MYVLIIRCIHIDWWKSKVFWVTFQVTLCSYYFCNFRKKVLDPNGPYISTFHTILRNVCLSVISEFCLSLSSTAYTSLCRDLKYLLEVRYIIPNDPYVARFLISKSLCLGRAKTLSYICLKKISQK